MKLFRSMMRDGDQPRLGPADLGVRLPTQIALPPGVRPPIVDVTPDLAGNVHCGEGMSTFTNIRRIPLAIVPAHHGGESNDPLRCIFLIDSDQLPNTLRASTPRKSHVQIEPAETMALASYESALASTQAVWELQ